MRRPSTVALLVTVAAAIAPLHADNELPPQLQEIKIEQKLDQQIPLDLPFVDSDGHEVKLGDYFGKRPVILTLVYYECPMLCTMVLNGVVSSLSVVSLDAGKDFDIVSVSIDPGEGPVLAAEKKREYINRYGRPGAAAGWHFLTGKEEDIRKLADAVGFRYRYVPERDEYAHASGIMVLTPKGRLARYFYGIEYPPRDLRRGLVEASANKIGTVADQVLLFCYRYDPSTGKYGAATYALIRTGGVLTILAMGTFFIVMRRRERRNMARRGEGS